MAGTAVVLLLREDGVDIGTAGLVNELVATAVLVVGFGAASVLVSLLVGILGLTVTGLLSVLKFSFKLVPAGTGWLVLAGVNFWNGVVSAVGTVFSGDFDSEKEDLEAVSICDLAVVGWNGLGVEGGLDPGLKS